MGQWIFGALMGVLAFLGLLFASRAQDTAFELFGYLLFLFGVVTIFVLIHRNTRPGGESNA
ncbi:hypothetical protein HRbin40_00332 [bacterium HR40]|nr:hypothetical protein HRbin40_00332 [bacterium HR40]